MVATRVHRKGVNENVLREGDRPGEFLISEMTAGYVTRENVVVNGGVNGVKHNSVIADADGDFVGIVFEGVRAGMSEPRGVLARGPAEVSASKLVFPTAPDGPDAGSDNVAETAALRELLLEAMAAKGIVVRN